MIGITVVSDCAISFPSDLMTSPTLNSVFKLTPSAIPSSLPPMSARSATWAECRIKLTVWWELEAPSRCKDLCSCK